MAQSSFESKYLPEYKTLAKAYPGDKTQGGTMSYSDLRTKITGNSVVDARQAPIEALRVSCMLNSLFGHRIVTRYSQGTIKGLDSNVLINSVPALKGYLTRKYGTPLTFTSASQLSGQSGIVLLDTPRSDGSYGSIGLWDGTKMHQMTDYSQQTSRSRKAYLWKSKGEFSMCFRSLIATFHMVSIYQYVDNSAAVLFKIFVLFTK